MADLITLFNQIIELPDAARSGVIDMARMKKKQRLEQAAPPPQRETPAALASVMAKKAPATPRSLKAPVDAETKVRSLGAKLGALQRGI